MVPGPTVHPAADEPRRTQVTRTRRGWLRLDVKVFERVVLLEAVALKTRDEIELHRTACPERKAASKRINKKLVAQPPFDANDSVHAVKTSFTCTAPIL
jgi:hypothetical protein